MESLVLKGVFNVRGINCIQSIQHEFILPVPSYEEAKERKIHRLPPESIETATFILSIHQEYDSLKNKLTGCVAAIIEGHLEYSDKDSFEEAVLSTFAMSLLCRTLRFGYIDYETKLFFPLTEAKIVPAAMDIIRRANIYEKPSFGEKLTAVAEVAERSTYVSFLAYDILLPHQQTGDDTDDEGGHCAVSDEEAEEC